MRLVQGMVAAVLVMLPTASVAQTLERVSDERRLFVDVNLVGASSALADGREFTGRTLTFGEIATTRAVYPKPSGRTGPVLIDVGGGILLARGFGIGVAYSRASSADRVDLRATIPHPVTFNAASTGSGVTAQGLVRTDAATHVFIALVPVRTDTSQFRILAGPSFFSYSADMVKEVLYDQLVNDGEPLFLRSVVITGITSEGVSGRTVGFHVGLDYAHFINMTFGITGGVRYSFGTVGVSREPLSALPQEFRVGSRVFFLGVRLRLRG
jgi:hypothetical protein